MNIVTEKDTENARNCDTCICPTCEEVSCPIAHGLCNVKGCAGMTVECSGWGNIDHEAAFLFERDKLRKG